METPKALYGLIITVLILVVGIVILQFALPSGNFHLPALPRDQSILVGDVANGEAWTNELPPITADLNANDSQITNVLEPIEDTDAATKGYVDRSTGSAAGGVPGSVQFNDDSKFDGDIQFTYDDTSGILNVPQLDTSIRTSVQSGIVGLGTQTQNLNMGGKNIQNAGTITGALDGSVIQAAQGGITSLGTQAASLNMGGNDILNGGTFNGSLNGLVTQGAQGSITSLGTQAASLNMGSNKIVNLDIAAASNNASDVASVQFVIDNASAGGSPGGPEGAIQYNKAGAFAGVAAFHYDESDANMTVTGNTSVTGLLSAALIAGALTSGVQANVEGLGTQVQALDMGTTNKIINLATPTDNGDAATKAYVDAASGSSPQGPNRGVQFNDNGVFNSTVDMTFNKDQARLYVDHLSVNEDGTRLAPALSLGSVTSGFFVDGTGRIGVSISFQDKARIGDESVLSNLTITPDVSSNQGIQMYSYINDSVNASGLIRFNEADGSSEYGFAMVYEGIGSATGAGIPTNTLALQWSDGPTSNGNVFTVGRGSSNINWYGNKLANIAAPTTNTDAATKKYVDDNKVTVPGSSRQVLLASGGGAMETNSNFRVVTGSSNYVQIPNAYIPGVQEGEVSVIFQASGSGRTGLSSNAAEEGFRFTIKDTVVGWYQENSLDMMGLPIANVSTATPTQDSDVASKKYVDDTTASAIVPPGSTGDILFNNAGSMGSATNLTYSTSQSAVIIGDTFRLQASSNDSDLVDLPINFKREYQGIRSIPNSIIISGGFDAASPIGFMVSNSNVMSNYSVHAFRIGQTATDLGISLGTETTGFFNHANENKLGLVADGTVHMMMSGGITYCNVDLQADGRLYISDGTVTDPGLSFSSNGGATGVYSVSANVFGISCGEALVSHFSSSGLSIEGGTIANLALNGANNASDAATCQYVLDHATAEANGATGDIQFASATNTLDSAVALNYASGVLSTPSASLDAGTFGAPSLVVGAGTNGLFSANSTSLNVSADGTAVMSFAHTGAATENHVITANDRMFVNPSGSSVTQPAISFNVDGSGIYDDGAKLKVVRSGQTVLEAGTSEVRAFEPLTLESYMDVLNTSGADCYRLYTNATNAFLRVNGTNISNYKADGTYFTERVHMTERGTVGDPSISWVLNLSGASDTGFYADFVNGSFADGNLNVSYEGAQIMQWGNGFCNTYAQSVTYSNGKGLTLVGTDHVFMEFCEADSITDRFAYFGKSSSSSDVVTLRTQVYGGVDYGIDIVAAGNIVIDARGGDLELDAGAGEIHLTNNTEVDGVIHTNQGSSTIPTHTFSSRRTTGFYFDPGVGGWAMTNGGTRNIYASTSNTIVMEFAGSTLTFGDNILTPTPNTSYNVGSASAMFNQMYAVAYNIPSDARIKSNVHPMESGLDIVRILDPVSYHKKDDATPKTYWGIIAQDTEDALEASGYHQSAIVPPTDEKGLYTVNYTEFIAPLISAVKTLDAQLQEEKEKNKTLEARLAAIEAALGIE